MGFLDIFFKKKTITEKMGRFETFTAYAPRFTSWSGQLYESDLIRAAVDAKARHVAKLQYNMHGSAKRKLYTITKSAPNPWMTWSQFLERCSNIYEIQNNLFIIPLLDSMGDVTGFFPVVPSGCEVVESGGVPYLKFSFNNGKRGSMELDKIAIISKHQLNDDFFGESNNRTLDSTMELINMVNQGIVEGVKNSASYRFMGQLVNQVFDEDLVNERKRFDRLNFQGGRGGGLLLFDGKYKNVQQLNQSNYVVDPKQMEIIRQNVYNYFGVNDAVLQNTADGDKLDAFYNGCIETFAIKLSEGLTKMVFTEREQNGGNYIDFHANRLQYMNVSARISMARELGDRGVLMIDEIRSLFNYDCLPDGTGQHAPIRGEYYMVDEGRTNNNTGDGNDE